MGIYLVNVSIRLTSATMKTESNFFLSFTSKLNIFVNFTSFSITRPVTYYFIHCYNHLHSYDSPNSIYNWHMTTKCIGSAITPIIFPYILTVKERYNPLDYFRMGIIEEISLTWKTQSVITTLCRHNAKIKNQGGRNVKKTRLKST